MRFLTSFFMNQTHIGPDQRDTKIEIFVQNLLRHSNVKFKNLIPVWGVQIFFGQNMTR